MPLIRFKDGPKHLPFTEAALRAMRHGSKERVNSRGEKIPANGYAAAFLKVGGSVLIDTDRYLTILHEKNGLTYDPRQNDRQQTPPISPFDAASVSPATLQRIKAPDEYPAPTSRADAPVPTIRNRRGHV